MNIEILRKLLVEKNLLVKETSKDFIVRCLYCGDHSDVKKQGHLYVSKNPEIPFAYCFIGNHKAVTINKLVYDLTADKTLADQVLNKEELKKIVDGGPKKRILNTSTDFKLPELIQEEFKLKESYVLTRTNNQLRLDEIPNLILDFQKFVTLNNLTDIVNEQLDEEQFNNLHLLFVSFLCRHHTMCISRHIGLSNYIKHHKLVLQKTSFNFLDYYYIPRNKYSNLIVLAEGVFDILGEFAMNSLGLKDKCRLYAAGLSFNFPGLLKSVCFDEQLFRPDVVILSDSNKEPSLHKQFKKEFSHLLNSVSVYYNKCKGGDFGSFPITPVEVKI